MSLHECSMKFGPSNHNMIIIIINCCKCSILGEIVLAGDLTISNDDVPMLSV